MSLIDDFVCDGADWNQMSDTRNSTSWAVQSGSLAETILDTQTGGCHGCGSLASDGRRLEQHNDA